MRIPTLIPLFARAALVVLALLLTSYHRHPCAGQPLIVYRAGWHEHNRQVYICPGLAEPLPLANNPIYEISPNGKWALTSAIAGEETHDHPEHLVYQVEYFGGGRPIALFPWQPGWLDPGWITDEVIGIPYLLRGRPGRIGLVRHGVWRAVRAQIPTPVDLANSSMDTYLFSENYATVITRSGDRLTFADVESHREIWHAEGQRETQWMPVPSPDGDTLIHVGPVQSTSLAEGYSYELFLIDQAGRMARLTDLSAGGARASLATQIAWSPDEQNILFWWREAPLPGAWQLHGLHLPSREVTPYAVYTESALAPVWLPDSRRAAVIANAQTLLLLDTRTGEMQILDEAEVTGIIGACLCPPP